MIVTISVPYTTALSKNWMYRHNRGRTHIPVNAKAEMDAIAIELKSKAQGHVWEKGKLSVQIMIYRPNMRADPSNFVDAINDAVKVATGVDDRHYSGSFDWVLDKENPRIEITVAQPAIEIGGLNE